eukprot:gene6140-4420_t
MSVQLEKGTRTGWLYNYHPVTDELPLDDISGQTTSRSALALLFQDHGGDTFFVHLYYDPYLLVVPVEGHEREVELGLMSAFGSMIHEISTVEKEDLDLMNHLSGRKRFCLKVLFRNTSDLTTVRGAVDKIIKRNVSMSRENPLFEQTSLGDVMRRNFQDGVSEEQADGSSSSQWMNFVSDMREYDVKYHMRIAIDLTIFVGLWYDVSVNEGDVSIEKCDESKYAPAMPRVIAFDIETTKAPLKFPQPEEDQIYMISYMLDGRGYLIINRDIVTADIDDFEYTPKPEYEGVFETFNEEDESATLRRFYDEIRKYSPNIFVTYNGDYFDFPFIHARSIVHGMNMRTEIGFSQMSDGAFLSPSTPHLDCFYWVKRDSYLPQGSQGLKAVTKSKLGYEPIEVDPENMLPLAQSEPQKMASYSVSDAVSTWYLYMKYVHPFIFSLATIIPMAPDDVLRKGSGGLCESLLMVQAHANNVLFPNKKEMVREKFHDGHLIDMETYIGGRVEALRSGVYRSNLPLTFNMNPDTYQNLMDDVESALTFSLEVENGLKREEVENFEEVKENVIKKLMHLRDNPKQQDYPFIYHLDVGAMYPNIILTNRLQPYAIPSPEVCAACCFNSSSNEYQCRRSMMWKWRGEMFTAGKHEFQRVKAQLENESFAQSVIDQTNLASVQKKAYGNRKGNVLENTRFERRDTWKKGDRPKGNQGGRGYRQESLRQRQEAAEARIDRRDGSDGDADSSDDDGPQAYHKLNESTQFNMLKKRLGEYSRKVYGKVHKTAEIVRSNVVCQRENSFYVDTVRLFRDRRYEYKAALKDWKKRLSAAKDHEEKKLCQSRCVQMESLQLAHKCILNSFYGYVMRKGSRWYSMEMAGIVTYLGATLIQMARALVQHIGITLELDTDGIWCCLPQSFPDNYTFTTRNPQKPKVTVSYPCIVLNKMVHDRYTNHQYQSLEASGQYSIRSENSIYFEVDGPYLAMLLPASREEGKSIKKRYAVFHPDGKLAELKGFELKRRGELMLIKDFQSQVFRRFLDGDDLVSAYASAAVVADAALDMLESKGEGYDFEEVIEKISESSNMSRRLSEYPETQKSLAITTARRIAEFLGPQMVKDKGLSCRFVISRLPDGRPVTERAIPLDIFRAEPVLRTHFIRRWTGDPTFPSTVDLQQLLDWDYYTARFSACVQKIITIPAALQQIPNPVPRVKHPDWLQKRIQKQNSRFRQLSIDGMMMAAPQHETGDVPDVEDLVHLPKKPPATAVENADSDWEDDNVIESQDDVEEADQREKETEEDNAVKELQQMFFTPNNTNSLDAGFFASPGVKPWLMRQKNSWLHRAQLRKELMKSRASNGGQGDGIPTASPALDSHFIDLTSRAITLPWHIVEIRSPKDDSDLLSVIALLERKLHTFSVRVPRHIVVDFDPTYNPPDRAVHLKNAVLPRRKKGGKVCQVPIPSGKEGDKLLSDLRICEGVRNIYEAHIDREARLIEKVGCCLQVDGPLHIENSKRLNGSHRDLFNLEELNSISSSTYMKNMTDRSVFIFHAASDARGILCLVNHQTANAMVIFIQAATVSRPSVDWQKLCDDACKTTRLTAPALHVSVEIRPDSTSAWHAVYQKLLEMLESPSSPTIAVLQSTSSTEDLIEQRAIPAALPYLRTLGAADDEKLLADPFRWSRLLSRRFVQRYYSSIFWIEEHVALSRISGIPMCNIAQDSCVHVLDVLYSRRLHQRSHVLWCSSDAAITFDSVEERPREVVLPGGYATWCVEFSLSRLDVVAILFSQVIQESDDQASHSLCDQGVSSHFNVLRDLVADLLGQAVTDRSADTVLRHITRWVRDPVAATYDPRLTEMLSGLSHRVLTAVLIRLAKLGGKTVKVDSTSIVVLTPKHSLQDCVVFSIFVTNGVQDQPMLTLLSLQTLRFFSPALILDHHNYASLYISASEARGILASAELQKDQMSIEMKIALLNLLPETVKSIFRARLRDVLLQIFDMAQTVVQEANSDPTVVVATKAEFITKRVASGLQQLFDKKVQVEMIRDVDNIVQSRELFSAEEKKMLRLAHPDGVAPSSRTVALEYAKCLCRLLETFSADVAGRIRNNCFRLGGVSPFSPAAQLVVSPLNKCRVQSILCGFCNTRIEIDLLSNLDATAFPCPECAAPVPAAAMEARLVRRVTSMVLGQCQQDFRCSKCHEVVATFLAENCCGPLEGIYPTIGEELQAFRFVAEVRGFAWLKETVDTALLCSL